MIQNNRIRSDHIFLPVKLPVHISKDPDIQRKGISVLCSIRNERLQSAGIGYGFVQQNIHLAHAGFLQHIEHHPRSFRRFGNQPVCASESRKIPNGLIHTPKEQRIAQKHFECDNSVEAIDPHIFPRKVMKLCFLSAPFSQLIF